MDMYKKENWKYIQMKFDLEIGIHWRGVRKQLHFVDDLWITPRFTFDKESKEDMILKKVSIIMSNEFGFFWSKINLYYGYLFQQRGGRWILKKMLSIQEGSKFYRIIEISILPINGLKFES